MTVRILVVDDNLINRKLACDVLNMEGWEVQQAGDSSEAIERLSTLLLPDLILMDISLPGMDGLALTRQLKADGRYAAIPVVAMTAFAMKGDEQKALASGCSGYITKPIDTRLLPSQIRDILSVHGREQEQLKEMIVEDHRIDMKLAGDCVRLSGHLVLSNTTAEDALATLGDSLPDVVLLDLNLPGMDGLSFVRLVKAEPSTRHLPVVAVTAYPDERQRLELIQAGCATYLVKPIDTRRLLEELEQALRRQRSGAS